MFTLMTFLVLAASGLFAAAVRDHAILRPATPVRTRRAFTAAFVGNGR